MAYQKKLKESRLVTKSNENITSVSTSTDILDETRSKQVFPHIFFCSRTHSQLQQVIDELKKMSDVYIENLHTTLLASKSHLCINKRIRRDSEKKLTSIDAGCAEALKSCTCSFAYKTENVVEALYGRGSTSSTNTNNTTRNSTIWDIEDIVSLGEKHICNICICINININING